LASGNSEHILGRRAPGSAHLGEGDFLVGLAWTWPMIAPTGPGSALLLVVELNGPTMMARIGAMRALNRNVVREFDTSRKDHHWGRRKLKRD
jgi:hypothetical protein